MESLPFPLTFLAAVGSGLMAGLFVIFSNTVMRALDKLPVPQGMAAMNSINVTIINPLFLALFFGTAVLCVALIVQVPAAKMLQMTGKASGPSIRTQAARTPLSTDSSRVKR